VLALFDSLLEAEDVVRATHCLRRLAENMPDSSPVLVDRHEALNGLTVSGWHFVMVNDTSRNEAFKATIKKMFGRPQQPRSIVDVGAGTGILSAYAATAADPGCQVYACEANGAMAALARIVLDEASLSRVKLLSELSVALTAARDFGGQSLDAMVTETFDAGLLGEHALDIYDHAWRHLLAPNATVIPKKANLYFFLLNGQEIYKRKVFQKDKAGSLSTKSFTLISEDLSSEPYDCERLPETSWTRLSKDMELAEVDFSDLEEVSRFKRQQNAYSFAVKANQAGDITAVAVWFKLHLDDEVSVSTRPDEGLENHWQQAVFSISDSIKVLEGEVVEVRFEIQGHVKLLSCLKKGHTVPEEKKEKLLASEDLIERLNCDLLLESYRNVAASLPKEADVLDTGDYGLFSLQMLTTSPETEAALLLTNPEDYKPVSEFLFAIGQENRLLDPEERVACEFSASLAANLSSYSAVAWDAVTLDGRLNASQGFRHVLAMLDGAPKCFLPSKVSMRCQLVASRELWRRHRADPNESSTEGLNVAKVLNRYAPMHLRNQDLKAFSDLKTLSAPKLALTLNAEEVLQEKQCELEVKLTSAGVVHGLHYWFSLDYMNNVMMDTYDGPGCYRQSLFLAPEPKALEEGSCHKVKFMLEDGLINMLWL